MSDVSFKWDNVKISTIQDNFRKGLVEMGLGVANLARDNAPYLTGALKNSVRVTTLSSKDDVYVAAGGNTGGKSVPYAHIHEVGGWTGRGHSVYIKPKHYLANALNTTLAGDWQKYFKGVA